MKYIVILGDGMADYTVPELNNKTPLQYAKKPNINLLAKHSTVGMVRTVPENISPGSDTANLSVLGYDPKLYHVGRSPLEAVSMGINLADTDVAMRCNLVTLTDHDDYFEKIILDHSSDEISSEEARILISDINKFFGSDNLIFHPGVSYRHCLVCKNGFTGLGFTPPHDILDRKINTYLPQNEKTQIFIDMMKKSYEILKNHPVNIARISRGLNPANSIWLWGEGKKPNMPRFSDKYNLSGSVISAVDLIKGIGICAGLSPAYVEGATGNIHTNFIGKAQAALNELYSGKDFVYIHIEAPDECGHRYEILNKVKSIEIIDEQVVGTLLKGLEKFDDYKILLLPDHPTPLKLRTHTNDPVPFLIYQKSKRNEISGVDSYDEEEALKSGVMIEEGFTLMDYFIKKN